MKLVIFGLTVTSSWGNGHATLWRGLCRALVRRRHQVVFFERDTPYYAAHRDLTELPGVELHLYQSWPMVAPLAYRHLAAADAGMVTSYCPDGVVATDLLLSSPARLHVFYDLDAPVTLARLRAGEQMEYLGPRGLHDFDLVLSYTGGRTLETLRRVLGARRVAPLYGSVDPEAHHPVAPVAAYRAELSYLGTYAADRQPKVEQLLLEPARRLPQHRFVVGGALYPAGVHWPSNVHLIHHVPPAEHPAFFSSSRLTLNVTRQAMTEMGYCPSGRLFEAAACGTPLVSDWWEGLEAFFQPECEIFIARTAEDVVEVLRLPDEALARVARAARERTLEEHTAQRRALELERLIEQALSRPKTEAAALASSMPPGGTRGEGAGSSEPAALTAPMEAGIAPMEAGTAPMEAGIAPMEAGIAPMEAGIAPMEAGTAGKDEE